MRMGGEPSDRAKAVPLRSLLGGTGFQPVRLTVSDGQDARPTKALKDRLIAVLLAQSRAGEQQQLHPLEFVEHLAQHRADRVGGRFRHDRHTSIG